VENVGSGREPFDGVDDQVEIIELGSGRIEEIRGHATRWRGRSWWKAAATVIGLRANLRVEPRRSDDLLDGVARHFGHRTTVSVERLVRWVWESLSSACGRATPPLPRRNQAKKRRAFLA